MESTQDYCNKHSFKFCEEIKKAQRRSGLFIHMIHVTCLSAYHLLRDDFLITKDEINIFFQF